MDYIMDWIETQLDDEAIFPQRLGAAFPPNFHDVVKTVLKRLFGVYAHIYHSHFHMIVKLKEEVHLNICFKHFVLFTLVSWIRTKWSPKSFLKTKLAMGSLLSLTSRKNLITKGSLQHH
ncbi:MOB kinase activator-like 2A [Zea mays]|uniref:MOB kinase activator-like 2A n=1 Tax=Zea mays TaxID=4577 RepID=A0A1D6Q8K1_MAIZE|nr:MOB kinase activator-like 2A [Zea mays]